MWILDILPEFFIHGMLLLGIGGIVAGFVLGFLPVINTYKIPIQIISIILTVFAVYMEGGLAVKYKQKVEIAELKEKLAKAEAKAAKVNTEIVTKILTKKQIVKEKSETIIEYVDREVTKYDNSCPIPTSVVNALNAAAMNKTVEETINSSSINEASKPPIKPTK